MGGVPISIEHLAKALRELGHEVYVFAPTHREQENERYVIRYPSMPFSVAGAPIPNVITTLFEKKVQELDIDLIHVHHPALVGNVALFLKKKYGIPVIFTYHTRYEAYLHYIKPLEWLEKKTGFVEKYLTWYCNQCDAIVAPTLGMKRYLENRHFSTPISVLPTGIPIESFSPNMRRVNEIRTEYGKGVDYVLCTVSRMAKEKKIEFQIRGLALLKQTLKKKQKSLRFLMIGDGQQKGELQELAKKYDLEQEIVFVGQVENCDITAYLKACDVFTFASKSETQGIVLLEAMAVGNPIVAVKASGVEDIVEDGVTGYLTQEEEGEWSNRILALLEGKELRKKFGEEAQRVAFAYEESEIAKRAVRCYQKVLEGRANDTQKTNWLHHYNVVH